MQWSARLIVCFFHQTLPKNIWKVRENNKMWGRDLLFFLDLPMRGCLIVPVFSTVFLILFFNKNLRRSFLPRIRIRHSLTVEQMRKVEEDIARRRQILRTNCRKLRGHLPREKKHLGHLRYFYQQKGYFYEQRGFIIRRKGSFNSIKEFLSAKKGIFISKKEFL